MPPDTPDHDAAATPVPGRDHYVVSRTVGAAPSAVFALLADPARHHETEPTDWVRGAIEEDPAPLTEVGQVFDIEMFHVNAGGRYVMSNRVIAVEKNRTLAWEPGQFNAAGELETGGWTWRYDLAPDGEGTRVTLTYDWRRTPPPLRGQLGLPPFAPDFLEESLAALERAVVPKA